MQDVDAIFATGGAIETFEAAKKAGKCRFFGFTGHMDPHVHAEMLKRYDKYDTILMPLNIADPGYLTDLPRAHRRCFGANLLIVRWLQFICDPKLPSAVPGGRFRA